MLYQIYETQRSLMEPFADFAQAAAKLYSNPLSPFGQNPFAQRVSAGYDLMYRLGKDYEKPEFGIRSATVDGTEVAVRGTLPVNDWLGLTAMGNATASLYERTSAGLFSTGSGATQRTADASPAPVGSTTVPPVAFERLSEKLSAGSSTASLTMATVTVCCVTPAAKLSTPAVEP